MNNIEELIAQLCPNGVEFKELGDTCVMKTGKGITKNDGSNTALYPIISGGKEPMGYYHNFNRLENTVTISRVGANAGFVSFINTKFYLNDKCFSILPMEKYEYQINTKFIFYFLKANEYHITGLQSEGGVPTINTTKISKIQIPIPPLPIQHEIVNILDKFTALQAELQAELQARRAQYEYYRNELLNFEGKEVMWSELQDFVFYPKSRISATTVNNENYVGVENLLKDKQGKTLSNYVPITGVLIGFQIDDILIGNIRPYLKKIWLATNNGGTNGDVLIFRIKDEHKKDLNPKFLLFLLSSDKFFDYDMQSAKGAKMPRGDKSAILKYKIPIPLLAEQERIVGILDKFDALVNDIAVGLPAEIEARRKQYEYYRGKLLDFKLLTH